jgi:AbrB family looped-hinge helix DNA binding protein
MGIKVKVSSKNQISVPAEARARLGIGPGDTLLVEVRENSMVLMREPSSYVDYMRGLHKEIWNDVDAQEYVDGERDAWKQ